MSDQPLLIDRDGPVAVLTLNRPEALNALSLALETALCTAFRDLSTDPDVRVIIVTGAGRAFSVGVDLKELEATGTGARDWLGKDSLIEIIRACPIPIIAAVNGYAITGGMELAMLADFIIASDQAKFADTHARVAITPSWGMTQILQRRIGPARAKQMSLTCAFVDADKALAWGLVNEVVGPDCLMTRVREIADEIAETERTTMDKIWRLIDDGGGRPLDEALAMEHAVFRQHIGTLTTQAVAQNRAAVQSRGRALNKD